MFILCALFLLPGWTCKKPTETLPNPPETATPLPHSMKGYELYGWVADEISYFTLITGTNRIKTVTEITADTSNQINDGWVRIKVTGVDSAKQLVQRLPQNEYLSYHPGVGDFPSPGSEVGEILKAWCEQLKLNFYILDWQLNP